jgi:hypothetical protein
MAGLTASTDGLYTLRKPDRSGIARAWKIEQSPELRATHEREFGFPDAGLSTWIVNGPYHPLWSWWHVGVIHLRDMPSAPPAQKQYPEAEYEFAIYSLNPDGRNGGTPDIDKLEAGDAEGGMPGFLSPPDVQFHFHGVTDEQAAKICDLAVEQIVAGRSCDSDFRGHWKSMLARTVEHYVLGVHS